MVIKSYKGDVKMSTYSLKEIKENITSLRKLAGYTQEEMAKALEISQPAYSYYEMGEKPIPLSKINKIAEILKTSSSSLIGDVENSTKNELLSSMNQQLINISKSLEKMYSLFEEYITIKK